MPTQEWYANRCQWYEDQIVQLETKIERLRAELVELVERLENSCGCVQGKEETMDIILDCRELLVLDCLVQHEIKRCDARCKGEEDPKRREEDPEKLPLISAYLDQLHAKLVEFIGLIESNEEK